MSRRSVDERLCPICRDVLRASEDRPHALLECPRHGSHPELSNLTASHAVLRTMALLRRTNQPPEVVAEIDRIEAEARGGVTTPPTLARVPNKPKTPVSGFRIPEDLKAKAQAKAEAEGKTLTEVVVKALERYVRRG